VVVHSFGAASWQAALADLQVRGLVRADGRLPGAAPAAADGDTPTRGAREARAHALWSAAGPIAGTLAEAHCRRRGVTRALPDALRFHPSVPAAVYGGTGPFRAALLAAITDSGGAVCGLEVTYLAADGARARVTLPRKTVGSLPAGAAVRLDPAGANLLVAEGVFTALSASERFGLPAWALLSTSNLRRWRPPEGVRSVLIAADRGRDGERSAGLLAQALAAEGIAVAVRWPPAPHGDWNEAVRGPAGEEERGHEGAGAADGWSGPPARSLEP
jgi:phage/plasmid primase-like uncharacterized protein